ncbi:MAG: 50S ribosomal protein L11 methyltransferase [Desulfotignum sp.]|nr:50S ribosomal protein L11 methyltransferase [Desulfotignum sp.]
MTGCSSGHPGQCRHPCNRPCLCAQDCRPAAGIFVLCQNHSQTPGEQPGPGLSGSFRQYLCHKKFSKTGPDHGPFFSIPPDIPSIAGPGQLDIQLLPGISFGSGHHPTTRLCLAAIDHLFFTSGFVDAKTGACGADIGTGSGVLAIALCLAGLDRCQACDIDPNAVSEAKKNIAANTLCARIQVFDHPLPDIGTDFCIICANLRTPTLENLALFMRRRLNAGGVLIFRASGTGKQKTWYPILTGTALSGSGKKHKKTGQP